MLKNKLYLFFVLFSLLFVSFSLALDCSFEDDNCDYNEIDWSQVEDFTFVDLENPNINWNDVDLSRIEGEKVSEIPIEKFDPSRILKENLYYASVEQIHQYLFEFENLADTNPNYLSQVFLNEYQVNIDFQSSKEIIFDGNNLTGDFPSYKPKDFPQGRYKQIVKEGKVEIIPLDNQGNELNEDFFSIQDAKSFSKDEQGNINLILGEDEAILEGKQQGKVILEDGTIIEYENFDKSSFSLNGDFSSTNAFFIIRDTYNNEKQLLGQFQKVNDVYTLFDFHGKQSLYTDISNDVLIQTTGRSLSIYTDGNEKEDSNYISYKNENYIMKGSAVLSTSEFNVFSKTDSYFEQIDGITKAKGILEYDNFDINYYGLTETSVLTRFFDEFGENVKIESSEEGNIAILSKKIQYGDLGSDGDLVKEGLPLTFVITKKNDEYDFEFDPNSILYLSEIERNPLLIHFSGSNLNLDLGDSKKFLTISPDNGIFYSDGNKNTHIVSPSNSFKILGNDLETLENVVKSHIQENSVEAIVQQIGIQRIFEMNLASLNGRDQEQFQLEVKSTFENMKTYISENYEDERVENIMLTSFMINNINDLSQIIDEEDSYISNIYDDLKYQIYSDPLIRSFINPSITTLREEGSDLNFVGDLVHVPESTFVHVNDYTLNQETGTQDLSNLKVTLLDLISNDPNNANFYKELIEIQLNNLINFEDQSLDFDIQQLKKNFAQADLDPVGTITEAFDFEKNHRDILIDERLNQRNNQAIINAYRGLLFLEDLTVKDGNSEMEINPNHLSIEKMILSSNLAKEYVQNQQNGNALSIIDNLQINLENSISEGILNSEKSTDQELIEAIRTDLINERNNIVQNSLNKIQLEIFGFLDELDSLIKDRRGWEEKIRDAESIGEKITTAIFTGGFGKSVLNSMGIFDQLKEDAFDLDFDKNNLARGTYVLNDLLHLGINPNEINSWIESQGRDDNLNERITANLILNRKDLFEIDENYDHSNDYDPYRGELDKSSRRRLFLDEDNNKVSFIYNNQKYLVNKDNFDDIFYLLSSTFNAGDVNSLMESAYSEDIRRIIGFSEAELDDSYSGKSLGIDNNEQYNKVREELKRFEISSVGRVFNYVDEVTSPFAIAASTLTGGMGLTVTGTRGLAGVGQSLGESLTIDLIMGQLVSSQLSTDQYSDLGIAMTTGLALTRLSSAGTSVLSNRLNRVANQQFSQLKQSSTYSSQINNQLANNNIRSSSLDDVVNQHRVHSEPLRNPQLNRANVKNFEVGDEVKLLFEGKPTRFKIDEIDENGFFKLRDAETSTPIPERVTENTLLISGKNAIHHNIKMRNLQDNLYLDPEVTRLYRTSSRENLESFVESYFSTKKNLNNEHEIRTLLSRLEDPNFKHLTDKTNKIDISLNNDKILRFSGKSKGKLVFSEIEWEYGRGFFTSDRTHTFTPPELQTRINTLTFEREFVIDNGVKLNLNKLQSDYNAFKQGEVTIDVFPEGTDFRRVVEDYYINNNLFTPFRGDNFHIIEYDQRFVLSKNRPNIIRGVADGENIIFNLRKGSELDVDAEIFLNRIKHSGVRNQDSLLESVYRQVDSDIPTYNLKYTEKLSSSSYLDKKNYVDATTFKNKGEGVCRHHAPFNAMYADRLIEEGLLSGEIYMPLGVRHTWLKHVDPNGRVTILDNSQRYAGPAHISQGPILTKEGLKIDSKGYTLYHGGEGNYFRYLDDTPSKPILPLDDIIFNVGIGSLISIEMIDKLNINLSELIIFP